MPAEPRIPALLRPAAALVVALAALTGCGSERPATEAQPFTEPGAGTTLTATPSRAGLVLSDGRGRALYVQVPDAGAGAAPACTGPCAARWPALATDGVPRAAPGTLNPMRTEVIGTAPGASGGTQVTYAGRALHRFAGDTAPGSTAGQGISEFGGTWTLVSPAGDPVLPAGLRG